MHCGSPSSPAEPGLHLQSLSSWLPAGLFPEFTGHDLQSSMARLPLASKYFSAPQSWHASFPFPGWYFPFPQSPHSDLLASEYLPSLHSTQVASVA